MKNLRKNELLNQPAKDTAEINRKWSERSEYACQKTRRTGLSRRPRLNLSACSDSSSFGLISLCILLLSLFAGCSRQTQTQTETKSTPAAWPASISSSEQAVKLAVWPVMLPATGSADAVVSLAIAPGYHINANPASFPYLIATELQPGQLEGITIGKPIYPSPVKKKFKFDEHPLAVYEGQAEMRLTLTRKATPPAGELSLPIKLRVQACDNEKCYPPMTIEGSIPVR